MNNSTLLKSGCSILLVLFFVAGCEKQQEGKQPTNNHNAGILEPSSTAPAANQQYNLVLPSAFLNNAIQCLEQFHLHNQQLQQAITALLQQHTDATWQTLRSRWLSSHKSWHLCDFYFSPIREQRNKFTQQITLFSRIHSVPMVAGYLDAVEGYPFSGLINDITVPLTKQAIADQHQRYDESEIAIGLHALEFFLWGRTINDYNPEYQVTTTQKANSHLSREQKPVYRRRQYLQIIGQLLTHDSLQLSDQWKLLAQQITPNQQHSNQHTIISLYKQLQQLDLHSEFLAPSHHYHWQAQAVEQLKHWAQQLTGDKTPSTTLIQQLEELHTLFAASTVDTAAVNQQLQIMLSLLETTILSTPTSLSKTVSPKTATTEDNALTK